MPSHLISSHPIPCRTAPPAALPISHASPSSLERAPESCRAPPSPSQLRYATYPPYQTRPGPRIDCVFRLSRLPLVPFWSFCSFLAAAAAAAACPPLLGRAKATRRGRLPAACLLARVMPWLLAGCATALETLCSQSRGWSCCASLLLLVCVNAYLPLPWLPGPI
jgi:hypothetical protein